MSRYLPHLLAVAGLGLATTAVFVLNRRTAPTSRRIIPSPRTTLLPQLSSKEQSRLVYHLDTLPGGRDVMTPYGSMRCYEFGSETGRKVVFIHGDATPAPIFKTIADDLVSKGCRVLLFDLWGRGYTDTPAGCQHDARLYSMQVLYAITSSEIAWTGAAAGRFSLIGFSMGGAIAIDFFAHYPDLVESVVAMGPAGLNRELPPEYRSLWFQHPSLVTSGTIRRLLGTLLGVDMTGEKALFTKEGFTPAGALQFQFDHHEGHLLSFVSTLQYAPLQHQHDVWKLAAEHMKARNGKFLVICGDADPVIPPDHLLPDLQGLWNPAQFQFSTVPADHAFPWTEGLAVSNLISEFWNLKTEESEDRSRS